MSNFGGSWPKEAVIYTIATYIIHNDNDNMSLASMNGIIIVNTCIAF